MIDILEQNGIVSVFVGDKSKKVNILDKETLESLNSYVDKLMESNSYPRAIIIRSVNESSPDPAFFAGADVKMFQAVKTPEEAYDIVVLGQKLFSHIDNMRVPTFAFVNGVCLGGALELALSCDYILASDHRSTKIGLPEVSLGIIPGWGGTQRLPKRVGYLKGIELITNAKRLTATEAKKLGLIDEIIPHNNFSDFSMNIVEDILSGKKKITKKSKDITDKLVTLPVVKGIVDANIKKLIYSKTKGHYQAPQKAFDVISASYPACDKYELEGRTVATLVDSPESKNLITVFQMSKSVSKYPDGEGIEYKFPEQVAVIGTGVMGNGIAAAVIKQGIETRVKAIDWSNANQAFNKVADIIAYKRKRSLKSDITTIDHLTYTVDYSGFNKIDFAIEAVFEDLALKQQIGKELNDINPDMIFASNTSSLSIADMGTANPANTIGLHFFNPANKMQLVEVIYSPQTSKKTIKTTMEFAKKLGKTPILMKDRPGFVVNRVLMPYLMEAMSIMEEGISQELIDDVLKEFGMPQGPIELLDRVGIDIAYHVGNILNNAYGARMIQSPLLSYMYDNKKFGKKTNEGFYIYPATGRKMPNTYVIDKCFAMSGRLVQKPEIHKLDDVEMAKLEVNILHRTTFAMINEACRILEEGVVDEPAKIDMAMIMGTGFPPFRGGLLRYADSIGIDFIVNKLKELSASPDDMFAPCGLLLKMQPDNSKFYN